MKKLVLGLISFGLINNVHAVNPHAIIFASINNCYYLNESVSWWPGHPFLGRVDSYHYETGTITGEGGPSHLVKTPTAYTDKHLATDRDRFTGTYTVKGLHYIYKGNREIMQAVSMGNFCASYNGWNN